RNTEPSPARAASAYYAVLCYLLGDFRPFIWRTDDYGATWKLLTNGTNGIPADEPTRVVREDPAREGLLYAGTEFGMYVSFDNGRQWQPFQLNLPVTPVTDMKAHRGDLAISTQGRAFWILDDLEPLRQMSAQVQSRGTYLFAPRESWNLRYNAGFGGAESVRASSGDPQYPQSGAMIDYWLPSNSGPVTLEIITPGGTLIRKLSSETASPDSSREVSPATGAQRLTKFAGLNRITWNTQYPGPWDLPGRRRGSQGPSAPPGTYTLKLTANGVTQTRSLNLKADPRVTADGVTTAILREQLAHNLRVRDLV